MKKKLLTICLLVCFCLMIFATAFAKDTKIVGGMTANIPTKYTLADLINMYIASEIDGQEIWGTYYQKPAASIYPIFYCKKYFNAVKSIFYVIIISTKLIENDIIWSFRYNYIIFFH